MSDHSMIQHSRPWITIEDHQAVHDVLSKGMVAEGQLTKEFELRIAQYICCQFAVAQGSGTAALILALKALGIGDGDGVVTPTYVCRNVLEALITVKAKPQLCDVDEMGVITPRNVEQVFDQETKAIIAAHIFGNPCNITELRRFNVPIIEDACQSLGLTLAGGMAGSAGDVGILSFHATKCLTTGEGGMMVTDNAKIAESALRIARGGTVPALRTAAPLSDLQSALGLSQLGRYSLFVKRRINLFKRYQQLAKACGLEYRIDTQSNLPFRFTLKTNSDFIKIQHAMSKRGIAIRRGVDELLHRLLHLSDEEFPVATRLIGTTISVPFYPALQEPEIERIEEAMEELLCL